MDLKPNIRPAWLRIILFLVLLLLTNMVLSAIAGGLLRGAAAGTPDNAALLYIEIFASFLAAISTVFVFCRFVEHRSMASLGTVIKQPFDGLAGLLLALVILGSGTLLLIANGDLTWLDVRAAPANLLTWLVLMSLVAIGEELTFRGYVLSNLLATLPRWWALVVSAIVFVVFHGFNPGMAAVPIINIFIGGLLLGVNYIYTRNLWFGIMFHFAWNFYQGPVLGYAVSGIKISGLLQLELTGHALITGGSFGFEGSVIYTILATIGIFSLAWINEKFIAHDINHKL